MSLLYIHITSYGGIKPRSDFIKSLCESKNINNTRDIIANGERREISYLIQKLSAIPDERISNERVRKSLSDLFSVKGMSSIKQKQILRGYNLARALPSLLSPVREDKASGPGDGGDTKKPSLPKGIVITQKDIQTMHKDEEKRIHKMFSSPSRGREMTPQKTPI